MVVGPGYQCCYQFVCVSSMAELEALPVSLTLEGIKQFYVAVDREDRKLDVLFDLYETLTITQVCASLVS